MTKKYGLYVCTYYLWMALFVVLPLLLLVYQSFFDTSGQFSLVNYQTYFSSPAYLKMTLNSFIYALAVTFFTLVLAYPFAYFLSLLKHKNLVLLLVILPTWINLLLKAYAFIGLFSQEGTVNHVLGFLGIAPQQLLFTRMAFILVLVYIELPFMILPLFQSIDKIPNALTEAARDLGASPLQSFWKVTVPLSLSGIRSGVQAVFIPSLSMFMITRLIGGNRVITLGTAVEEHYLVTRNWGMGSTIGVVLMGMMFLVMALLRDRKGGKKDEKI
ncbi:ABC transporter permease [Aerococcus christensenii]|uniref:ABC transporter permease n=1 Tax=Aerococcus christensenii TaxID=87541 RepID=A0A109RCV3_9LACT|nr:ABC transporter permease [Aerococcus christensenii]AMB92946.1 spermidine/putrescine ABC transporter permease [Aerococcus christensenii]KXB36325.1 putative spermidine/putrescine ABC transporter, permease protein PotB [Aerococcus christensenii]MDK8234567.1 ABC transporter permease [Aerococcus christensenii]PKY91497.1 ABC transporter permease [Aerococcus christensenii]WEB71558.1 ABC transporter permease [Aerococcus christensenii]